MVKEDKSEMQFPERLVFSLLHHNETEGIVYGHNATKIFTVNRSKTCHNASAAFEA